jgi:hypothetical protein
MRLLVVPLILLHALHINKSEVKILQLTDLHYGEGETQDLQNNLLVADLLDWEKPDLAVITGDLVSGYMWKGQHAWFQSFHSQFVLPLEARNIPWAFVLGNHDGEGDLTGDQIVELDRTRPLSLIGEVKQSLPHSSNYYVVVQPLSGTPLVLWLLDTGNRNHCEINGYDCLHQAQLDWQRDTYQAMVDVHGGPLPGLAFMHIPPPEYIDLWNSGGAKGHRYEDVACWASRNDTMRTMSGLIGVGAGHDHFNDYEGTWQGTRLYYGRKTGSGGQGPDPHFDRGARVYSYNFTTAKLDSWIRTEKGKVYRPTKEHGLETHPAMCAESTGYSLTVHHLASSIKVIGLVSLALALIYTVRLYFTSRRPKEDRFLI